METQEEIGEAFHCGQEHFKVYETPWNCPFDFNEKPLCYEAFHLGFDGQEKLDKLVQRGVAL